MSVPSVKLCHWGLSLVVGLLLLAGCNQNRSNGPDDDTPTSGRVRVSVDETFAPILKSQVDTFQKLYTSAHIEAAYKAEDYVTEDLMSDKARTVVLARQLTEAERAKLESQRLIPHTTKIATDGLAIVLCASFQPGFPANGSSAQGNLYGPESELEPDRRKESVGSNKRGIRCQPLQHYSLRARLHY